MLTISDICAIMARLSPPEMAQNYDNTGLLIGKREMPVNGVLCALDVTDQVIDEAISLGANMIISHHPLIFGKVTKITDDTRLGRAIMRIIQNNIAVYAAHTNLDSAHGGTNDCLAEKLGLTNITPLLLEDGEKPLLGRMGELNAPMTLDKLARFIAVSLNLPTVKFVGNASLKISTVAVCSGSGGSPAYFKRALACGCNCYITGDVTYHNAQAAAEMGLSLIDATHFATEIIVTEKLASYLTAETAGIAVHASSVESNIFNYSI